MLFKEKFMTNMMSRRLKRPIRYFSEVKTEEDDLKRGFSEEYMKLTKKMKLKTINDKSSQKSLRLKSNMTLRIKTESETLQKKHESIQYPKQQSSISIVPIRSDLKSTMTNFQKTQKKFNRKIMKKSRYSVFNEENQTQINLKSIKDPQQNLKLNENPQVAEGILQNIEKLWQIRKGLQKGQKKERFILETMKIYVMQKGKYYNFEEIFQEKDYQEEFKEFIAIERCFIIGVIDVIARDKLYKLVEESQAFFNNIFGFYKYLLKFMKEMNFPAKTSAKIRALEEEFTFVGVHEKVNLTSTVLYLGTKIHNIYRFNLNFYHEIIKKILKSSTNYSISRTFYILLTEFAKYFNENDIFLASKPALVGFATCPSPYILQSRKQKKYSLVLDLDETLVHTNFSQGKYMISCRPYAQEFVLNLSHYYEIIIFTSSMSAYAQEIVAKFQNVAHLLCRQHTIRIKNQYIKDLNRIGRPIESMLIVDNLKQNFKMNKTNGIEIEGWFGNPDDEALKQLQKMLKKIAEKEPEDLRQALRIERLQFQEECD